MAVEDLALFQLDIFWTIVIGFVIAFVLAFAIGGKSNKFATFSFFF